jgi:hypothetical protein
LKSSAETVSNVPINDKNISLTQQLKQNVFETVDALLRTEQIAEQIESKLLVKKKKKRRLHL